MLSKIQKKKKAEKHESLREAKEKKVRPRVFGDFVFDYFRACRHKEDEKCPFCKLVTSVVRTHFEEERQAKDLAKIESKKRRAYMRYNILDNWSKNQANFVEDSIYGFTIDVALSGSFVNAASNLKTLGFSDHLKFEDIFKLLQRKRRILEVGFFAAQFIQARIRSYLSRRRLRRELLRRFEYVPAASYRGEFYLDTKTFRKVSQYPPLLRSVNERPNTPKTINRRLTYEENQANQRYVAYLESLRKSYGALLEEGRDPSTINIWEVEDRLVYSFRQMAIVEDLVEVMVNVLISQVKSKVTKLNPDLSKFDPNSGGFNEISSLLSIYKFIDREVKIAQRDEERAKLAEPNTLKVDTSNQAKRLPFPCILGFTAPSASARIHGLAVILAQPSPYNSGKPKDHNEPSSPTKAAGNARAQSPKKGQNSPGRPKTQDRSKSGAGDRRKGGKAAADAEDAEEIEDSTDYNKRLRDLEQRVWDSMICVTPGDVVDKLMSEDTEPVLASAVNFATDEYGIWNGKRILPLSTKSSTNSNIYHIPNKDSTASGAAAKAASDEEHAHPDVSNEVLPFSFQLRPFCELRGPQGLFRLFFFENELVAVTQSSPWAFYNEIYANRESILKSIRGFANTLPVKNLVKTYFTRANPGNQGSMMASALSSLSSSYSALPPINRRPEDNVNGGIVSCFLPGENTLFNKMEHPLDIVAANQNINKTAVDPDQVIDYENFYYSKSDMQKIRTYNYLTDEQIIKIDQKYKFFSKLTNWKDRLKRAQTNYRNAKRNEQAAKAAAKTKSTAAASDAPENLSPLSTIFKESNLLSQGFLENYGLGPAVSSSFRKNFEDFSTKTNTSISQRMIWKDSDGPTPHARYDLLVMDVMVNVPFARDIKPAHADLFKKHSDFIIQEQRQAEAAAAAAAAQNPKALKGKLNNNANNNGEANEAPKDNGLAVNMHQIVGIFSTENDKSPPNVDFSLFEWETFCDFRKKREMGLPVSQDGRVASHGGWSHSDPKTGICDYRGPLPSGNEFSMKILGCAPSPAYLSESLSPKVKAWIDLA